MSLDTVVAAMAAKIKTDLPELKTGEAVGGVFDLAEMRRHSTTMPAVYVCCTGTQKGRQQSGKFHCRGLFLAVLAIDSRAVGQQTPPDRASAVLRLAGRALHKIAGAGNWAQAEVAGIPEDVASRNPYNAAIDANNLALWAVTWEQQLELVLGQPLELDPLTSINATYQMTESTNDVDAEDEIDTDGP